MTGRHALFEPLEQTVRVVIVFSFKSPITWAPKGNRNGGRIVVNRFGKTNIGKAPYPIEKAPPKLDGVQMSNPFIDTFEEKTRW